MGVPSNAMWFRWLGRDSRDYGLVLTDLPHIITPSRNVEEVFVSNASKMPMLYNGYNPYDIQLSIAYIGKNTYWSEQYFMGKMNEFFYERPIHQSGVATESDHKLVLSSQVPYYMTADFVTQLDFTNFYKYRTATVQFHCLPFRRELKPAQQAGIYTDQDLCVSDMYLTNNWDWENYQVPVTRCVEFSRRPKIEFNTNSEYIENISNVKYMRLKYVYYPDAASKTIMEPYKKYCVGREFVIDWDTVCNKIIQNLRSMAYDITVTLDLDRDRYYCRYVYTQDGENLIYGESDISDCINTKINYGGSLGTPQDYLSMLYGYNLQYLTESQQYNINRRTVACNCSNDAFTSDKFNFNLYTSTGAQISGTQLLGTITYYPLANII